MLKTNKRESGEGPSMESQDQVSKGKCSLYEKPGCEKQAKAAA
jgi:hypothetical protein